MNEEKTYTLAELQQAQKELDGYPTAYLARITAQVDKNRLASQAGEFTEEQVRTAVARRVMRDYSVPFATRFAEDVIAELHRKPRFTPGQVYAKPCGDMYRRVDGGFEVFGSSTKIADSAMYTGDLKPVVV